MSFISSFEILSCCSRTKYFFCILTSEAEAAAVNLNGIKTLLAYGLIILFINDNPVFNK